MGYGVRGMGRGGKDRACGHSFPGSPISHSTQQSPSVASAVLTQTNSSPCSSSVGMAAFETVCLEDTHPLGACLLVLVFSVGSAQPGWATVGGWELPEAGSALLSPIGGVVPWLVRMSFMGVTLWSA